jgi:transposase
LPPYSPDLSSSEAAWSKRKTPRRAAKHRAQEALERGLGVALPAITPQDARSFFGHGGYAV